MSSPRPAGPVFPVRMATITEVNTITEPIRSRLSPSHREPLCSMSEALKDSVSSGISEPIRTLGSHSLLSSVKSRSDFWKEQPDSIRSDNT